MDNHDNVQFLIMCQIMFYEPSFEDILDLIKAGYLPSSADRCVHPDGDHDAPYYFTDFIDDQDLLDSMVEHNSSSNQKYWHMNELSSFLQADYEASSHFGVSCMLLKSCGSINFGLSFEVNGFDVTYDLYFDIPCTK